MNVVANLLTDCMPFLKSSCLARETCRAFQMARISSFFLSFLLSLEHLFLRQCFVLVSQSHSFDSSWKSWSTCDCGWCILWQCKWCGTTSPVSTCVHHHPRTAAFNFQVQHSLLCWTLLCSKMCSEDAYILTGKSFVHSAGNIYGEIVLKCSFLFYFFKCLLEKLLLNLVLGSVI